MKLYAKLAQLVDAYRSCMDKDTHADWMWKHRALIDELVGEHLPSGSGVDSGCQLDMDASRPEKLVIITEFHHMDEHGGYDGWTMHRVIVTPSLRWGFDMRVTGKDSNDIKNYLGDLIHDALDTEVTA